MNLMTILDPFIHPAVVTRQTVFHTDHFDLALDMLNTCIEPLIK